MSEIPVCIPLPFQPGSPRVRAAAAARYGGNLAALVRDAVACHVKRMEHVFNNDEPFAAK